MGFKSRMKIEIEIIKIITITLHSERNDYASYSSCRYKGELVSRIWESAKVQEKGNNKGN